MGIAKKITTWVLCLVLAVSMLPAAALTAFAAEEDFAVTGAYVGSSATSNTWVAANAATASQPITIQVPPLWVDEPLYIDLESSVPNATYQILIGGLPAGVTLDKNTGVISGTPTEGQTGFLTVRATSPDTGETCSFWLTLNVYTESAKPGITTESCADGNVNKEYYQMLYQSSHAQGTYTYTISSGKLPDGLSIENVGSFHAAITGTPTKAGTFNFTVKVESFLGSATKSYTITIGDELIRPDFNSKPIPFATRQATYTVDLNDYLMAGYTKPITSWSIDADDLAAVGGMTFDPDTGILTGTPENTGRFYLYVKVGNAAGMTTRSFELDVYDQPSITTAESSRTVNVGEYLYWPMTATGSSGYWSVSDGELPTGIYLSGDGVIWGDSDVAGTFPFTVRYTVEDGLYAEKDLTLVCNHIYQGYLSQTEPFTFFSQTTGYEAAPAADFKLYNSGTGTLSNVTATLSGANADVFSVSGLGATLASKGEDEFTVTAKTGLAAGTYTATLTVKSGDILLGSFDLSFSVEDEVIPVDIVEPSMPFAAEGKPWSYQFQATGTGPFTWELRSIKVDGVDVSSYFDFDASTGLLTLTGTPGWENGDQISMTVAVEGAGRYTDTAWPYFHYYTLPKIDVTTNDYVTPYGTSYDNTYVGSALKRANAPHFSCYNDSSCTVELEGQLPDGVELYNAGFWGDIQGTPTEAGTFSFRLKATKEINGVVIGTAVTDYVTMTVYEPPKFQEEHSLALPELTATVPMEPIDLSGLVSGGKAPLTYSVDTNTVLPDGISLDPATGILSGTPTTPRGSIPTWPQFTVTDANGKTDTITFNASSNDYDEVYCPAPVIEATGDSFAGSMKVTLSCPYTDATIYFRTDGKVPNSGSSSTMSSPSGGIYTITEEMADENGVVTLTALADFGGRQSAVVTKTFTVVDKPAAVTADVASGTEFAGYLDVRLDCTTAGTTIYYTTDGSTPSKFNGSAYGAPITLDATTTLKAVPVMRLDYSTYITGDVSTFTYTRVPDTFGFELDTTELSFSAETGYTSVASQSITVENTGNVTSNPLTASLSGDGMDAFILGSSTVNSMYPEDVKVVTVTPKAGMPAGTYIATLTLDNDDVDPMIVTLSFEVTEAPATYTVLFYLDGGDEYATSYDEVEAGQTATPPEDPAPEGKVFLGWYTDPVGGEKFDFSTPITGDVNLYARFEDASSGVAVTEIGGVSYAVSGQVVTVDSDVPCKLGYLSSGSYVAIAPVANPDGTYSFTAPAGVTEVLLVVKGDVSGDGKVSLADRLQVSRSLLPASNAQHQALSAAASFAADVSGDGKVSLADRLQVSRSLLPASNAQHQPLAW